MRRVRYPSVVIGNVFEDVGKFFEGAGVAVWEEIKATATDPVRLGVRIASVIGWPAYVASFLPGILGMVAPRVIEAAPGLVRGENFVEAWTSEYVWRMRMFSYYKIAEAGVAYSKQVERFASDPKAREIISKDAFGRLVEEGKQRGLTALEAKKDAIVRMGLTPEAFASECARVTGTPCREDAIATVINALLGEPIYKLEEFSVPTGKRKATPGGESSSVLFALLEQARIRGRSPSVIADLRRRYEDALFEESRPRDASWYLEKLLRAQNEGASPDVVEAFQLGYENARVKEEESAKLAQAIQIAVPTTSTSTSRRGFTVAPSRVGLGGLLKLGAGAGALYLGYRYVMSRT